MKLRRLYIVYLVRPDATDLRSDERRDTQQAPADHAATDLAHHTRRIAAVRQRDRRCAVRRVAADHLADRGRPGERRGRASHPGDRPAIEPRPRDHPVEAGPQGQCRPSSAAAIDSDQAELAVIRRDRAYPRQGLAIAVLRENVVVDDRAGAGLARGRRRWHRRRERRQAHREDPNAAAEEDRKDRADRRAHGRCHRPQRRQYRSAQLVLKQYEIPGRQGEDRFARSRRRKRPRCAAIRST